MNRVFAQILRQNITNQLRQPTAATAKQQLWRMYSNATASNTFTKEALDKLVRTNKVVIFMKGNPEQPMCGFSNAVVQILRMHGVEYDAHDVLQSDELRQSIKDYSEWPTIPQVYMNGEFLGGCDIMLQMHQSGDLIEKLQELGIESLLLKEAQAKEQQKNEKK